MQLTSALFVAATALGGLSYAHPHLHGVHHQHHHQRRATDLAPREPDEHHQLEERKVNFYKAGKPCTTTSAAAAAKTPASPPAAPAPAATGSSAIANVNTATTDSAAYRPFCGGATSKRASAANIAYVGNTGTAGNWGCNMMTIPASIAGMYDYKASFTTTGGDWSCSCFNKIGPTNLIDGFWHTAISFTVSGSQTQWVAFEANTQGACACGPGASPPKTSIGQWAGTWLEVDMGDSANGGNSGADASVLVAGAAGLPYYGMSVSANGNLCSWVKSNGQNFAAYMPGMEAADGVGCKGYLKNTLTVVLGD